MAKEGKIGIAEDLFFVRKAEWYSKNDFSLLA